MGREDFTTGVPRGGHRQPYVGRGLFAGGIVAILVAVTLAASSSVAGTVGLGAVGARELAGGLAGIGLAAALVGAIATVPTDRGTWYRGVGGAFIACVGVAGFLWAYPGRWYGDSPDLTLSVVAVYFLGVVTVASYLFAGVSDLTRRVGRVEAVTAAVSGADVTDAIGNERPSGTARTDASDTPASDGEVLYERTTDPEPEDASDATEPAETPTIDRIEPAEGDFAWPESGFEIEPADRVGSTDRAPTSTRSASAPGASTENESHGGRSAPIAVASNGAGTITAPGTDSRTSTPTSSTGTGSPTEPAGVNADSAATEGVGEGNARGGPSVSVDEGDASADGGVDAIGFGPSVDRYCGNCGHFQYVRTGNGLSPYCGYHDEVMDDMEPCLGWTSNA